MRNCCERLRSLFLPLLLVLLFAPCANAQEHTMCGTTIQAPDLNVQSRFVPDYNECTAIRRTNRTLQVVLYFIHDSLGNPGVAQFNIDGGMAALNGYFEPIGLQFEVCDTVHIPNFEFDNFLDSEDEANMLAAYYRPDLINIYFASTVAKNGIGPVGGYAYFPGGLDVIVMTKESMNANAIVLAHEMGHFFGLFHTFETENGVELVNASNCETAGDLVCDTPANPTDSELDFEENNIGCNYIGQPATDANGEFYLPPADNIMSYSPCGCRFTPGQYNRMLQQYQQLRNYLW